MGENEGWAEPPSGLLPNGLLPTEAASVIQPLDLHRWVKAEERTAELIACIQPNPPSEERRNAVADYVQRLIIKCFPCQVFTFGSVPLKTYLPDGDIDLTAFSKTQNIKETWAHQVRDMLQNEEKNENAEFHVKEVQYIQAEVKIIKCLVENIVVDISFNQLGGLCTLCFLEEVDHLINQNHLFKRSIILIKAWCYYESRILGAHHGLISTYALETLVLYIFHVFNNSFTGPLEVLYRFLEFFSKFDWDNFCVSLWGPVPISSLPDVTAEPPRKDGGELLLSKLFLDACSSVYAVFPGGLENQGQPFVSKHFNVIDPLRINNNLGRSVSKGNFYRIRSAFAFGAKRLARLLDCPKEDLYYEVNQFFMNTWERHGSGHRPDVPRNEVRHLRLSNPDHLHGTENLRNNSISKRNEFSSGHEAQVDRMHGSHDAPSQHGNHPSESTSRATDVSTVPRTQSQKNYGNLNNTKTTDQIKQDISSNQSVHNDKIQRSSKPDNFVSDVQGRFPFARTRSSPELTEMFGEVSSQGRRNRAPESGKGHFSSTRMDNSRRKNLESDALVSHGIRSSADDPSSVRHISSRESIDDVGDTHIFHDGSASSAMGEEFSSVGTHGMHQEEQDCGNMMASSSAHNFNRHVNVPLNLASAPLPLPIPSSILASMGYTQRNLGGMVPSNFPFIESPWGANMQFPHGLVSSTLNHYFPGIGLASNPEVSVDPGNENFISVEVNPAEIDPELWHEQDRGSIGGFDLDNGSPEILQLDDKQQSTSAGYNFVPSSRSSGSGGSTRVQQKTSKENRRSVREDHLDNLKYPDHRVNEIYLDEITASSRSIPASHTSSVRSKTSSESSWEGSSATVSKSVREKRGRKTASSAMPSATYGKGKNVSEHSFTQADDDTRDWIPLPTMSTEMSERNAGPQSVASFHVPRHQIHGLEPTQSSGSDSLIPFGPVLLGHGSRQRTMDNSGVVPFAFYPTGPPVPFVTMLPVYNFPAETGNSEASTSHFTRDEGPDNNDPGQNFDPSDALDHPEMLSTSNSMSTAPVELLEHKSDILNGDFASHWHNLQFGRFCQNSRPPSPMSFPSPVVLPRFPWDNPGRPLSANMNLFTQLTGYGPHIVPVAPVQSVSGRPAGVYQRYVDEMPRYRSGTGTYLPNPKVPAREWHSSSRRGNYNYDRIDHHNDREGNWNSKSRAPGRSRSQADKSSPRADRLAASESRAERPWGSHRHDILPSSQSQNNPIRSNSTHSGPPSMAYGMYQLPVNPGGVSSNGPSIPSVVMLYQYDENAGYSSVEQLEFGSLGPVGGSGVNEASQHSAGSRSSRTFEEQRYHGRSAQHSSPDQPSSPHLPRGL